jgi:tetratricopeptide (TPR) repeat protein
MAFNPSVPAGDDYARVAASIAAAIRSQDLRRAYEIANWALGRGITGRVIFNTRGLALQASGRHYEAIEDFRRALEYTPNDEGIHNALGMSYLALERSGKAVEAFDAAVSANPNSALSHYRRGIALAMRGNQADAQAAFERAIEIRPDFPEAIADLAALSVRQGDRDRGRELAERSLALKPSSATANFALTLLDLREGRFAEAEQKAKALAADPTLDNGQRIHVMGMIGDALDAQKRYDEAFAAYRMGNEIAQHANAGRFEGARGGDTIRYMTAYFEKTSPAPWQAADAGEERADGPAQHVFLLGFMRSGTTLLEQVLASNPRVVAFEEKGTLNTLSDTYMTSPDGLDRLSRIAGDELAEARSEYWGRVAQHADDLKGKILVDKQPLNTVKLPLIAKLFPKAKVLFALRDPRDVVFSCYRRQFRITSSMVEFLTLTDAANFYAGIMNLGTIYRDLLPLNLLEHRYEDMVADFEGRVRAVCDFIGIDWSDSMRDFDKNAPKPDLRSPSASQVQRPLYAEGVAQWRKYADQLAPMMPILAPWVERFGYPAE